jgi:threonylcarbamoyladenosine tRNA methylthiotransferase MtaB
MNFIVTTLGCKVNQFESDAIAQGLENYGWQRASEGAQVETCIINTCTVTGKASMQSRQAIRQLIRAHPKARIIVTGCYAQTSPGEIERIEGVHYIVGQLEKSDIPRLIIETLSDIASDPVRLVKRIPRQAKFSMPREPAYGRRTRPFLKIQDGCDRFCTYCIVPHARGPSRSMPLDAVLERLTQLGRRNFREVVLTGIHLGAYGADFVPPVSLIDLLARIEDLRPVERLRLSSIEPDEVNQDLVALLAASPVFCPHLHLPLQSGDDHVLERMHRPYDSSDFAARVRMIANAIPQAAIGADVLVGFPGEDQAAFDHTCDLIAALPLTYLHVFPFSARPGTLAFHFPDQVPDQTIKARSARLRKLGQQKKRDFIEANMGHSHRVLIEGRRDRRTGWLKGLSANYIPTLIQGDNDLMNRIVTVKPETILPEGRIKGRLSSFAS